MKKLITAMTLIAGLVVPSFADLGGSLSSFEPQSVEGVRRRPHGEPPPPPPPPPPAEPVNTTVISTPDSPVRIGGRVAIGGGAFNGFTHVNVELGGALHIRVLPMVYGVAEVDLAFRNYSKEYDSDRYWGYRTEFEDSFTEVSLDIPLIGRFQPLPFVFFEGGLKLGINLTSFYSDTYSYYDASGDYVDGGSLDNGEWDADPVIVSLVAGMGFTVKTTFGNGPHRPRYSRDVDVGLRFVFDFNNAEFDYEVEDKDGKMQHYNAGEGHPWSIQFQVTYLL